MLRHVYCNPLLYNATLRREKKRFENNVRKGENAGNQRFLLFSPCVHHMKENCNVLNVIRFVVYKYLDLEKAKLCCLV